MKLFPAIDMLGGRAVRLKYGDKKQVTDYGDPIDRAKCWQDMGAKRLHIVDLDGAFGDGSNLQLLGRIAKMGIFVQTGGGIRCEEDIAMRIDAGVSRVILGTLALDTDFVAKAVHKYGDKIACGIDCRGGKVSVKGWTEDIDISGEQLGLGLKQAGVRTIIYTDIDRDGVLTGINFNSTVSMSNALGINVIASGGLQHIEELEKLSQANIYGAILGRSIYTGSINLKEALCLEKE